MRRVVRRKIWFFFIISSFLFPVTARAQVIYEFTPRISMSEVYEDNIYLDAIDEKSDYLTTASPGVNLTIRSRNNFISLDYSPTWVWYDTYNQNDTVRHSGNLSLGYNLTEHVKFDLTNTYLKSEEPLEETEEIEGVRRTRNTYRRNTGSASFQYRFGQEDSLIMGYKNSLLKNEDVTLDNGTIQNPFVTLLYWVNVKNGFEFTYEFTRAIFWRDDESIAGDDYDGHTGGLRYVYRFSPHTKGSIGYTFTNRDFEGVSEDYEIHEGTLGFEHAFSPSLSIQLESGIFTQDNDWSDDETGYSYNASLAKRFKRGSFTLGGRGGWDEAYLDSERRGFTKYRSAHSRLEYTFIQRLKGHAGGSFRHDRDGENREWETWRGNCGLSLEFLRWFSLSLDYTYAQRDDDVGEYDYTDNRVMLTLTGRKLYGW